MRLNIVFLFILSFFAVLPALAEEHVEPVADIGIKITDSPEDIKVPAKMWELIPVEKKSLLVFVPVSVILTEKNPGILKQSPTQLNFPRGGGEIDFSRYLTGQAGSFYVKFIFDSEQAKESSKVFFISQTRKRKIDGEVFGSGCKKMLEIGRGLEKVNQAEGILVNTTRSRHITVLGGSFIFVSVQNKDVRLSQVTFRDSNHPDYFCEIKKNEAAESL